MVNENTWSLKNRGKNNFVLILVLLCSILISCSDTYKIESTIQKYVTENFNDPKSYEVIDIQLIDTLTIGEASQFLIDSRILSINDINRYINEKETELSDRELSLFLRGKSLFSLDQIDEIDKEKEAVNQYRDTILYLENSIKKLKPLVSSNEVVYYRVKHSYRADNGLGSLMKFSDTLSLDGALNIINDPNEFVLVKINDASK